MTRKKLKGRVEANLKAPLHPCPHCKTEMRYVCNVREGNDTGYGSENLYQCDTCKMVITLP